MNKPDTAKHVSVTIRVTPATRAALAARAAASRSSVSKTAAGIITRSIQAEANTPAKGTPLY